MAVRILLCSASTEGETTEVRATKPVMSTAALSPREQKTWVIIQQKASSVKDLAYLLEREL